MRSYLMAKLTDDQKKSLAQWAAEGATLNDIQDRMKREFDLTFTYMDTRLLVMELGLKLQDKPKEKLPDVGKPPQQQPSAEDAMPEDMGEGEFDETEMLPPESAGGAGDVTVTIDQIAVPGAMVSGKATFSDGKTAGWSLDQFGRLGLRAPEPGYQPPPADIPMFQRELQRQLQKQGY
jgi:hypothetical protein